MPHVVVVKFGINSIYVELYSFKPAILFGNGNRQEEKDRKHLHNM